MGCARGWLMTSAHASQLEGIRALQDESGVTLNIGGSDVVAIVDEVDPPVGENEFAENERVLSRIGIVRDDLDGIDYAIGTYFEDEDSGFRHRVISIKDHPRDPQVIFFAETSKA